MDKKARVVLEILLLTLSVHALSLYSRMPGQSCQILFFEEALLLANATPFLLDVPKAL